MDDSYQHQHQHQQSAWTSSHHPNNSSAASASPDQALDDAMSRFGSMSLGGSGIGAPPAPPGDHHQQLLQMSSGVDTLAMGALSVAGGVGVGHQQVMREEGV